MIETSLADIFSGDLPRIDRVVIVPDKGPQFLKTGLMASSAQLCGNHFVGFNPGEHCFKLMEPDLEFVVLARTEEGFRVERGNIPEYFQGTFTLGYRPSFKEAQLPKDDDRVLKLVEEIKTNQAGLDDGVIGSTAYYMDLLLWRRTRQLGSLLESLGVSL